MASVQNTLAQLTRQFESLFGARRGAESSFGGLLATGISAAGSDRRDSGSVLEAVAKELAPGVFSGPLGLLAGVFSSLFRRTREEPDYETYAKPEAISVEYDVASIQKPANRGSASVRAGATVEAPGAENPVPTAATPVVIQVSAMDAQSFSNRSDDIAAAVREALARSHGLRDEIWED